MAVKAGEAFLELSVKDSKFRVGLEGALNSMRSFAGSLTAIGAGLAALGSTLTATFGVAARTFAEFSQQLAHMSSRTGVGAQALSQLAYAAEQSGVDMGSLEVVIRSMQRNLSGLDSRGKQTAEVLRSIGVDARALGALTPDEQLNTLLRALGNVTNPTLRAGAAMRLFGRSGTAILPLIGHWKELSAEAQHFNLVVSAESVKRGERLRSAFDLLGSTFRALKFAVGDAVGDGLTTALRSIAEAVSTTIKWVKANQALVATTFRAGKVIIGLGTAVILLGGALPTIVPAIQGLSAAVDGLSIPFTLAKTLLVALAGAASVLLTPFGAVVAAVTAAGAAFVYFSGLGGDIVKFLGRKFGELAAVAGETFSAIGDALAGGDILAAANVLWAGLKLAWLQGTEELRVAWASFSIDAIEIMTNLVFDVQSVWTSMASAIKSTWAGLVTESKSIGEKIGHYLTRSTDDPQLAADQDRAHNQALDMIAKEGSAAQRNIENERDAKLRAIEEARSIADGDRQQQKDAAIKDAQDAVGIARKSFDEARKRAAAARAKGFAGGLADDKFNPAALGDIAEAGKGITRSTFSGRLAGQIFGTGGSDALPQLSKQQLKELRLVRNHLKGIEAIARRQRRFMAGNG